MGILMESSKIAGHTPVKKGNGNLIRLKKVLKVASRSTPQNQREAWAESSVGSALNVLQMLTNKHPELDRCPNLEKLILLAEYEKLIAHIDEENTVYTKNRAYEALKKLIQARTLDTRVASSDANSFSSLLHLAAEKIDKISTQLTQEHAHYTDTKEGLDLCRNMSRITAKIKYKVELGIPPGNRSGISF